MLWTRAKGILIAVLLLVNLLLFGIAASIQSQKVRLPDSYLDDMGIQLERAGVQIDRQTMPDRREFAPQITIATKDMLLPLARTLLGDDTLDQQQEADGSRYENAAGTVTVSGDGVLLFVPVQAIESLSQLEELLLQAGFDRADLLADQEGGRLHLLVDGLPVDGCGLVLQGGAVYGRLLQASQRETVYKSLLDPPNALLRFAEHAQQLDLGTQTVTRVETVYRPQQGGRYNTLVLTPAYRITAGSGVFLVNAMNGAVERAASPLDELPLDGVF